MDLWEVAVLVLLFYIMMAGLVEMARYNGFHVQANSSLLWLPRFIVFLWSYFKKMVWAGVDLYIMSSLRNNLKGRWSDG